MDAADLEKLEGSRNELHNLIDKPQLMGIPVLVLGNKRDLPDSLDEKDLIERMYVIMVPFRSLINRNEINIRKFIFQPV